MQKLDSLVFPLTVAKMWQSDNSKKKKYYRMPMCKEKGSFIKAHETEGLL